MRQDVRVAEVHPRFDPATPAAAARGRDAGREMAGPFLTEGLLFRKHCGFLDLSLKDWQAIQDHLMAEQLELLHRSPWRHYLLGGASFRSVEHFRAQVPLTTYDHYAPYVRDEALLPSPVQQWAYTTGPRGAAKWVPYTQRALERVADDAMAAFILAAADGRGKVLVGEGDRVIYNVAPPPYLTGLIARVLQARFALRSLPPLSEAEGMAFHQRLERSFRMALRSGADVVCSLSSVLIRMGEYLERRSAEGGPHRVDWHPTALLRQARAGVTSWLGHRPVLPRDLWRVKAVIGWGLDTSLYRHRIAHYWGREPYEFHACTEAGILGMQAWNRKGLTPVPYAAFLEFLPEAEAHALDRDPALPARPRLLEEVAPGERYEVVLSSFYGMPFVRYRTGHLVRILARDDPQTGVHLPQFQFVGRTGDVIDLAGFTRLDEKTLWEAIAHSPLAYTEWTARKEFHDGQVALHLYLEWPAEVPLEEVAERLHQALKDLDPSYRDLEEMLGLRPLRVTALPPGTFRRWPERQSERSGGLEALRFPRMGPAPHLLDALLHASVEARRNGREAH